ncbi:hypothetical protein O988_02306 [Pseudogymnoascus sp. VKM F-3808]|nr:hypothetical protein O988_02306 [Pseudogymnoascus sp. VKM F-3808]
MRFSAITLAFLGSLIATAYTHPGTSIVERDFFTVFHTLEDCGDNLMSAYKSVEKYEEDNYEFTKASQIFIKHIRESLPLIKESGPLSPDGATSLWDYFRDLLNISNRLEKALIVKRPVIKGRGRCFTTYLNLNGISAFSHKLVDAIIDNNDTSEGKDTIRKLSKRYLAILDSARDEFVDSKCPHKP